jgi:hypothetical protein
MESSGQSLKDLWEYNKTSAACVIIVPNGEKIQGKAEKSIQI